MKKRLFCIIICMLLIVTMVFPVSLSKSPSPSLTMENFLYVGGIGPNNYTKIQDAINDSSDGDTVFVYDDSSPYYEHLVIDTSINLIGENKDTTVIDGKEKEEIAMIVLQADGIIVQGFTITNVASQWNGMGGRNQGLI